MKKIMDINAILKIVIAVLSAVLVSLGGVAIVVSQDEPAPSTVPTETTQPPTTAVPTEPTETEPVPTETEPDPKLDELRALNEKNPDIDGWIMIEDTIVDFPVAYTPDEPDKYIRMNIEGKYSYYGTPYISKRCKMEADEESQNLIIYGHNLENGKMFSNLHKFDKEDYWKEHKVIEFWTTEGHRTYEIMAAFYDRIYFDWEKEKFEFYRFTDAENEEEWNEMIGKFKEKSCYDTGVDALYGDRLLMLITCSYHTEHGRFVLIAVEHTSEKWAEMPPETTAPTQTTAPTE
ncbi:MAG: class B sortase [Oscillospiraceae bacterium]|nr:class B sortase [Oscillospiraceae bacterium]